VRGFGHFAALAVLGSWRELSAVKDEEFSQQATAIIERFAARPCRLP
jgi:hypothetical protein